MTSVKEVSNPSLTVIQLLQAVANRMRMIMETLRMRERFPNDYHYERSSVM